MSNSDSFRAHAAGQVCGFVDGERVRDRRTGLEGRVRILELTDAERAEGCAEAEVVWDGLVVRDELELAIDNGLERIR